VPWYDPALDPNTEVHKRPVHRWLDRADLRRSSPFRRLREQRAHESGCCSKVELARKYQKRVVGLPTFGATHMSPEAALLVDVQCPWDAKQIIAAVDSAPTG